MSSKSAPTVMVIGLDGVNWELLDRLFADGAMPNLKAFVDAGVRAPLQSVLPTNSMSAWTSMITGVNPGKHGVYDFVRRTKMPFRTSVTNSSSIRFPTLGETLSANGLSTCMIDVPPLYPPYPINGVMMGGIGAVTALGREYASPPEVVGEVERAVGAFLPDVPWVGKAGRQEELVDDLVSLVENRRKMSDFLLRDHPVDLFFFVFVAPDRAQHVFWRDIAEEGPQYPLARRFYQALDEAVGGLLDRVDLTATDVLLVSDHGFRRFSKTFDVNEFLLKEGLMNWRWKNPRRATGLYIMKRAVPPLAGRIEQMLSRPKMRPRRQLIGESTAYSDIADSVNVNLLGREITGYVPPWEFDQARERVAEKLLGFHDPETGEPVVRHVIKGEECFQGPYAREGPDLMLECHDGYAHNSGLGRLMYRWEYCQGVHSLEGIVAGLGPHMRRKTKAGLVSILDVAPTVLSLLGLPSPEGTDGRIADELLTQPARPAAPGASSSSAGTREEPGTYSEEEEELVRERLQGLGYID